MSNENVVFLLNGDAMRPSPAPWGFIARNPLQRVIPPGTKMTLDLQITANVPMLAFPTRTHAADLQVLAQTGTVVLSPGTVLAVTIENKASTALVIDDGEGLVCLHPLTFSGTSEVG